METEQGPGLSVFKVYVESTVITNFFIFLIYFFTDSEETYYKLSEAKICRFYAEFLLRPAGRVGILVIIMYRQSYKKNWKMFTCRFGSSNLRSF